MNIHEYQAKAILRTFGVAVLRGRVACTGVEAKEAAQELGGSAWMVKAQIHAGGRGKAGGIKIVQSSEEAESAAASLIGKQLVTFQTGAKGVPPEVSEVSEEIAGSVSRDEGCFRSAVP